MNNICWVFEIDGKYKKLNRIGFYRNSIGRCSSHAERFSILLSNISLNMNRMNNICALNSFDLKCVEYYVWFYFISLCFFVCVDKLTTETTTARLKHWIKQQISVGLTKRFGNIKEKWEQNESIYSILVVFCLFVVLWIFVLIKNARSTLTHSARTEIWSCDLCICEVIEWFFVHSTLLFLLLFFPLFVYEIDWLFMNVVSLLISNRNKRTDE